MDVDQLPPVIESDPLEELVINLRADDHLASEYFLALERPDGVYLPLGTMADALLFALEVSPETGTATGWIINEQTTFDLDLASGTLALEGRQSTIPDGAAERHVDDIYVSIDWLSEVTPLHVEMDWPTLSMVVSSEGSLPVERLLERRNRWASWRPPRDPTVRQPIAYPFRAVSPPAIDVSAATEYSTDGIGNSEFSTDLNLRAAADLGWHTGQLFIQADNHDGLKSARLTLSREDPAGGLLGPLQATGYQIGDVSIPALSHSTRQEFATGVTVTNRVNGNRRSFTDRTFTGTTQPGWAVELYRNGVLLAFTEETEDGRYVFEDVDVLPGFNDFIVLELGPLGEVRQTSDRIHIGSGMVPPGTVEYAAAVGHPTAMVDAVSGKGFSSDETVAGTATVDIGLLTSMTVSASIAASDGNDGEIFGSLAGRLALGPVFVDATMTVDRAGGRHYALVSRLPLDDMSFSAEIDIDDGLESPHFSARPDQWSATLSGNWNLAQWARLAFDYSYVRDAAGIDQDTLETRWRGAARYLSWSNTMRVNDVATGADEPFVIAGSLNANIRSLRIAPRLALDYQIDTMGVRARSASASFNWRLDGGYRGRLTAAHDFRGAGLTSLSIGAGRTFGPLTLGASAGIDTDGAFEVGLTLSTGAAWDPWNGGYRTAPSGIARNGTAAARVVLDDGTARGPQPLDRVRVRSGSRSGRTDESGVAMIPPLTSGRVSPIDIVGGSLDDPFLLIESQDTAVTSRPGVVQPVTMVVRPGGEAEGTIRATRVSGEEVTLSGATLLAIDDQGEVASRAVAAFDGFYILNDLLPGDYTLTPDPDQVESLGYAMPETTSFTVPLTGGVVNLGTMHLFPADRAGALEP
ncbi:hypothetical protein [Fodinicurvata sp. EGI_FJ10296]|uniref:hypothetical protein n=1 Tax=Fodinicurvata sp. EGI_FJ10296 TaxID=3231908 RepID=UPI003453033B